MNTRNGFTTALLTIIPLLILSLSPPLAISQQGSRWEDMPEKVRERKSFKRFEWFYRQRALPNDMIPEGALERAREEEMSKEQFRSPQEKLLDLTWSMIGPTGVVSTWPTQWGINSGRVRALAIHPTDPNTVYIGPAAGGIWKTTDGGSTWQDVGGSLASLTYGAIDIDPNNTNIVYAGAGESIRYWSAISYSGKGLYKSTNAGGTWTQITNGITSTTHFGALRVSKTNANTVFAALGSGYWHSGYPGNEGLWRSTDAGVTWTRTLNVDDGFDVLPHPTTTNRVYGATGGKTSTGGFYVSTNNGSSWSKITSGLPSSVMIERMQIALCTSSPSILYALIYDTLGTVRLYKSTNDGTNWSAVSSSYSTNQGWYDLMVAVNPNDANEVYIGTEELRRSTDGGTTFNYVGGSYWSQSMHVDFHIMAFAPSNPTYRYVGSDGGIHRSTNGGSSWVALNATLPTLQYYRLSSHPTSQNILIGGSQDNGLYRTTNGGSGTWALVSTGDGMESFYDYNTPTTVYASTQSGGLVKSTSNGDYGTFSNIKPSTSDYWAWTVPFFIHPTNSSTIYTASQRPWRSTNGGATWTDLAAGGLVTAVEINTMAQSPVTPNNMILAASEWTTTPAVHISTNGGTSWTNVTSNIGGTAAYISRVVLHPTQGNTCFVVRSGFSSGNKVYRSTNMGTNWTNISGDLPNVPHNDLFIDPDSTSNMYAANDLGVYRTTNGGTNWTRQGSGLPYVPAIDFSYFSSGGTRYLRVGTHGRSAYQALLSPAMAIQVIAPNGSEVWPIGSTQTITWTSTGLSGNVKIDLTRDGGSSYETLAATTADDGSESWVVTGPATPLARVRVSSVSTPSVRDSSDNIFNIIQISLTLVAPNGGETWTVGPPGMIQWTSFNHSGNVQIDLSRDGGASFSTIISSTPDDGMEFWPVSPPASTQARIRIASLTFPYVSDTSNSNFSIVQQPTITLISPNGGELWPVDSVRTVLWSSTFLSGNVKIELSRNGGSTYETLFANTANDGTENWTVTLPPTTHALVKASSVDNPAVLAISAGEFTISGITTAAYPVEAGWNAISVPLAVPDPRKSVIYPDAVSPAYMFLPSTGYIARDTMINGVGYWLKFPTTDTIDISGVERTVDSVQVNIGWNLIGTISDSVAADSIVQIPSGIVTSSYYGYINKTYQPATVLKPGSAYWVKVNQNGVLVLRAQGALRPRSQK